MITNAIEKLSPISVPKAEYKSLGTLSNKRRGVPIAMTISSMLLATGDTTECVDEPKHSTSAHRSTTIEIIDFRDLIITEDKIDAWGYKYLAPKAWYDSPEEDLFS